VVGVLGHQHSGEQARARDDTIEGTRGRSGLDDLLAAAAAQLRAHMAQHFEARRHIIEHLGDIFAELGQLAAAVGTGFHRRQLGMHSTRQVLGQSAP